MVQFTTSSPHWSITFPLPNLSPTRGAQAGLGLQRRAAVASLNSSLLNVPDGPGRQRRKAVECLSLWPQLLTGRAPLSLYSSRALVSSLPLTSSLLSTSLCLSEPSSLPAASLLSDQGSLPHLSLDLLLDQCCCSQPWDLVTLLLRLLSSSEELWSISCWQWMCPQQ